MQWRGPTKVTDHPSAVRIKENRSVWSWHCWLCSSNGKHGGRSISASVPTEHQIASNMGVEISGLVNHLLRLQGGQPKQIPLPVAQADFKRMLERAWTQSSTLCVVASVTQRYPFCPWVSGIACHQKTAATVHAYITGCEAQWLFPNWEPFSSPFQTDAKGVDCTWSGYRSHLASKLLAIVL